MCFRCEVNGAFPPGITTDYLQLDDMYRMTVVDSTGQSGVQIWLHDENIKELRTALKDIRENRKRMREVG